MSGKWVAGKSGSPSGMNFEVDGKKVHVPSLGIARAWVLMILCGIWFGPLGVSPTPGFWRCFLVVWTLRLLYLAARQAYREFR